jgi:hypothetical protein
MTPAPDRDDARLRDAMSLLNPAGAQARRIEAAVMRAFEARPPTLASEWLGLFRARPIANTSWLLAAAAVLLLTTPLGALLQLAARALKVA